MTPAEIDSYRQSVLAAIRRGELTLPDLKSLAEAKAALSTDHRRVSMAKAQEKRLKRRTTLASSRYYEKTTEA